MANIKELIQSIESPDSSFDEKLAVINEMQDTLVAMKEHEQEAIDDNVELIIEALRTIEAKVEAKLRIIPEKGEQGIQGQKGEQGDRGLDGAQGKDGKSGVDGKDGLDGKDGVSVQDAKIDFDGSLVITLSDGREINVGEVVPVDVAQTIHKIQSGSGGDSQTTLNAIAALQATIATYGTMATQNANAVAITGGTINNTTVGATTPSTGVFTTLTATGQTSLGGVAGSEGLRVLTPTLAGNYAQINTNNFGDVIYGNAGSGTNIPNNFLTKGTGVHTFSTNNSVFNKQAQVSHTASAVNAINLTGGATTKAVIQSAIGSDSNISYVTQSKGTGAIDLAAGSSGVNISNGGTVTAVTLTANGSAYTSFPTLAISTPTTAGSVQATASFTMRASPAATIASGGTGYTVGDVLTFTGGTFTSAIQVTVATVSSGVITGITSTAVGSYSVLPSNPISVTGGTGSGATFNQTWGIASTFTITNAGSGYVEQPTVSFSGGGGSGAAAYASVGSSTVVRTLGGTMDFSTPSGRQFQVSEQFSGGSTAANYIQVSGRGAGAGPTIGSQGTDTNISFFYIAKGSGSHLFTTSAGAVNQFEVAHTASAVNNVQVRGAATGSGPTISAQGSDTNVTLNTTSKGTGYLNFSNGFGIQAQIGSTYGTNSTAYPTITGTPFNQAIFGSTGSTVITAGGSNSIALQTASTAAQQFVVTHTASAVNFVQVTGAATGGSVVLSSQGSDSNVPLNLQAKGSGYINAIGWMRVGTASANYIQLQAAGAGSSPVYTVAGSDTNIPLVLQPKGTGALQAQQTDSTTTGGNARGAYSVDWQLSRNAASKVASGNYAVVAGGFANVSSASYSSIAGGYANTASNGQGFIGAGENNTVSGYNSAVVGGQLNTSGGFFNFIGGGFTNSATTNSAVTTQSATMNGTTAVTLSGSNASIKVGQYISGTSIAFNTYVAAISGTSLTLSQVASGSSTSTLSFFTPHGVVVGGGNNQATGSYSFIGGGGDAGTASNRNVASGDWSTVGGGFVNRATGKWSTAGGGGGNLASGEAAVVVGGGSYGGGLAGNTASSTSSFVGAGYGNTANGYCSIVVGGNGNVASNNFSFVGGGAGNSANTVGASILGGYSGTTRSIEGMQVMPACVQPINTTQGTSQAALLVLAKQTTDATATVLTSNTSAAGTTNQVILPNNSAYAFRGTVIANVTGGGNTKAWAIEGAIKRGANAASTALVGTATVTSAYADVGAATWAIAVTADTTNGGLAVTFTGQAATTIRCVAKLETTEVTF